jgi:hypothetical protein
MTNDVLRALAEARPAHLEPEAGVPDEIRAAETARAMAGRRETRRRSFRLGWPVWAAGLAGAAAVTALAVAFSGTTPRAPDQPTKPVALSAAQVFLTQRRSRPPVAGRTGTPSSSTAATTRSAPRRTTW